MECIRWAGRLLRLPGYRRRGCFHRFRAGDFLAITPDNGGVLWKQTIGIPIRQTAAVDKDHVIVTAEDLRVRCFRVADGQPVWTSEPLPGQTARDYYPVIIRREGRAFVIVRTNPLLNMGQRIGRDRTMLCRNAGVDAGTWQKLDAWLKSDQARGTPELWAKEQRAILEHLEQEPDARTFFVLDAATGKQPFTAPVLWIAGCQAVGAQPALTGDGRLLVFYRSAYGNWNHGVAPMVALGLMDLETNRITPLFHQQGAQPRWNCFWGTADESQNFLVAGETAFIVHQGTLSGFDLKKNDLFPIAGERDTFGGFRNPPWARNEWHGPGRSGVAVAGNRVYWQTGSRILCLVAGESRTTQPSPKPTPISKDIPVTKAPPSKSPPSRMETHKTELETIAQALLTPTAESEHWAPLFTDPGLAGRVFAFDHSGELFEALAWAYPHLPPASQAKTRTLLRAHWNLHPPCAKAAWYPLNQGAPREWFHVPGEYRVRLGGDKQPHPFGNLAAIALYAERCGEENFVLEKWPQLKSAFEDFTRLGWRLDAPKGDLFANRYLGSLLAMNRLAEKARDPSTAERAKSMADDTASALLDWWKRAAAGGTLTSFNKASELDPFIGKGDGISLAVAPHRHKLALFQDLSPEVASLVLAGAPEAAKQVWTTFRTLCPTWDLMGEERQVHFGENFVDPPDFALSSFRALAFLERAPADELSRRTDLPFCRADLYHLIKLAITLDAAH